jgi:hypothetical protein
MSFSDFTPEPRRFDYRFWVGCFAVIGLFVAWQLSKPVKPVLQNVPAPPFMLPAGCNPADVTDEGHDFKPRSPCFDEKYLIRDYERYNFFRASGSRFFDRLYYRFYDKAVHLVCDGDKCIISHIHHHVFVESNKAVK